MNIICEHCGFEFSLPDGITEGFCGNCGAKVVAHETEAVEPTEPVEEVIVETVPVSETVPVETSEPVVEEAVPVDTSEPVVEKTVPVLETTSVSETTLVPEKTGVVVEKFEFEDEPAPAENKPESGLDGVIAKFPPAFKKIRPFAIIAAIIICVLIGFIGVTVVIALSGNGSYKSAESKNFDALASLNDFDGILGGGVSTEFDVTYAPSEDIFNLFPIAGLLSEDTDELSAKGFIEVFGNSFLVDVVGHADYTDAHLVGAFNGNEATLAFPDATDYVYRFSLTDTTDENIVTLDMNAYKKTIRAIEKEYFRIVMRSYEVEKGEELTGGAIVVKADKYTFKFTREDTLNFILFAIEQIRENDNLVEYITKTYQKNDEDFSFDEILDDYASILDDELFDLSDSDKEDTFFRMRAWVYKGSIISREIDNIRGAEDIKLSYTVLKNTKALYANISILSDYENYRLNADFLREGKYWNGDLRLQFGNGDNSLKFSVKNMALSNKYLIGKASLRGTLSYSDIDIDFEFDKAGKRQQLIIDGEIDNSDLGILTLTYQNKNINSLKLPSYPPDDIVDYNAIYNNDDMYEKYQKLNKDLREYFS
jgi:hypothetical protein